MGNIKNNEGRAMSVGLLVARLKYGLYIVQLSKWFVVLIRLFFVVRLMVALSSLRFTACVLRPYVLVGFYRCTRYKEPNSNIRRKRQTKSETPMTQKRCYSEFLYSHNYLASSLTTIQKSMCFLYSSKEKTFAIVKGGDPFSIRLATWFNGDSPEGKDSVTNN